ncbi:MAG: PilZ domain-containing protein [Syntrophobacterales bacterium]
MEKRTFARIPFKTKAIVRQKDSTVIGIVENLSLAGIFLKTPERLGLNRLVKIELLFTMGMGIEFRNLDLDAFFHLKNLITYNTDKIDTVKKEFQKFDEKQDHKK